MAPKSAFTVKKYMKSEPVTLSKEASVREALKTMIEKKTNGIVIVEGDQSVVGILSSWDLIQYLVPDYLEEDKHLATFESSDQFEKRLKQIGDNAIDNCMTKNVHTVREKDSLMAAATILSEFRIRQLPVVDEDSKLVGYLNRTDIKQAMGEALGL